jgi:RNA polymerase sigma factor (sigma-70 family)
VAWSSAELQEHWTAMVRAAYGVLGSWDEAEECAGQALVQVLERAPDEVDNVRALLVIVAKRRALDRLRVLRRERALHGRLAGLAERSGDLADDVASREEACWLAATARATLRPPVYELLRLVAEGHSLEEVSLRLGITRRAVQGHLRRARSRLKEAVAATLGLLGVVLGWRPKYLAAPAATAVAVALTFTLLPSVAGPGTPGARPQAAGPPPADRVLATPAPSRAAHAALVRHTSREVRVGAAAARAAGTPARPVPVAVVHGPLGMTTTVQSEQHGSGPPAGPVGTVVECLQNFQVSARLIGC